MTEPAAAPEVPSAIRAPGDPPPPRRRVGLGEQARRALVEAVLRRQSDPEFAARVRRIVTEDRELLDRLAR